LKFYKSFDNLNFLEIVSGNHNAFWLNPAEFHFKFHDIPQLKQPIAAKLS